MKNKMILTLPLICVMMLFTGFTTAVKQITLSDAITKGLVQCTLKCNPQSPHYVRPLIVSLTNLTNTNLQVQIPNGQQFYPEDAKYQNLVVTYAGTISLSPQGKKSVPVYAMCTEATDAAPAENITYKIGAKAGGSLAKLTQRIEELKCNDIVGQHAVWSITNNNGIDEIIGPDEKINKELQQLVSKLTGRPIPEQNNNYKTSYGNTNMHVSYSGTFYYSFSEPKNVVVALFNKNNVVVRELLNNPALPAGEHKLEWAFDNSVYTDDIYYVRLIADGDIRINRKIDMKPRR